MPSLKELKNPEVKDYVKEFYGFGSDEPTENVLKIHKLLQHWTAGQHGVGTWHGAGPLMAQKIMLQRVVNYEHEKSPEPQGEGATRQEGLRTLWG
jgi:4-hydroxybutyryl-CoA dehydratase/vinylacetyl-CoA-Delta-isomerase